MGYIRETDPLQIRTSYGLALDEIKLKRGIQTLTGLLGSIEDDRRLHALRQEMNNKKKQLETVQQLRT